MEIGKNMFCEQMADSIQLDVSFNCIQCIPTRIWQKHSPRSHTAYILAEMANVNPEEVNTVQERQANFILVMTFL